jgi:microcystin-dependent protein/ribosomal protein L12E/L44/L45/RPP1/RPP2
VAFTPYSWITYPGDGTTDSFVVPFPYAKREHVRVFIGWDPSTRSFITELTHDTDFDWPDATSIVTTVAPATGETISLVRETPIDEQLTEWQAGSPPTSFELNTADLQVLYALQEFVDRTLQTREDLDEAVFSGSGTVLIDSLNSTLTTAGLTANQGRTLRLLVEAAQDDAEDAGTTADAGVAAAAAAQAAADAAQAAADAAQATADAAVAAADETTPPSTVAFVARNTAPAGWLKANGAAVSRTTYADLFAAIGTTFGAGNGTTTFNLPDLRGEFPRGWDDGRGIDTGRAFGSAQGDLVIEHTHNITGFTGASNGTPGAHFYNTNQFNTTGASTSVQAPAGGAETRPRNIALLAVIKF